MNKALGGEYLNICTWTFYFKFSLAKKTGLNCSEDKKCVMETWFSGLSKPLFPVKVLFVIHWWPRVAQVFVERKIIEVHPLLNSKVTIVNSFVLSSSIFLSLYLTSQWTFSPFYFFPFALFIQYRKNPWSNLIQSSPFSRSSRKSFVS